MPSSKGWKTRADERTMRETPIGSIVDDLLVRERAFARGLPVGRLAADWTDVVGPRLASESAPVSLDGGVLVVAASSGPWGAQVRFMTDEIRRRANERLGADVVTKVQVTVRPDPSRSL
jgi:predicted nucleic acid-binding Zn ribbon protein